MHVPVHQPGQDQPAGMIQHACRRRRLALADRGNGLAAHRDEAVLQDGLGGDHVASDHEIERS